jgi:phosphoenolpyruvate synthase/pyruvate phosphate dikinase
VEWGITAISVEPQAIEATAQVIARAEQVHAALMGESNSAH